jgi:hypothetical protein
MAVAKFPGGVKYGSEIDHFVDEKTELRVDLLVVSDLFTSCQLESLRLH